jgi:glutamyl/glutaminyl-tRNA synthetase
MKELIDEVRCGGGFCFSPGLIFFARSHNSLTHSLTHIRTQFSLENLNHSAAVVDVRKLVWFNKQLLKRDELRPELVGSVMAAMRERYGEQLSEQRVADVMEVCAGRTASLHHFVERAATPFFVAPTLDDEPALKMAAKSWRGAASHDALSALATRLESIDESAWASSSSSSSSSAEPLTDAMAAARADANASGSLLLSALRLALTGQPVGPSLVPTMQLLGKRATLDRLSTALEKFDKTSK